MNLLKNKVKSITENKIESQIPKAPGLTKSTIEKNSAK